MPLELTWSRRDGADCLKVSGWPAGRASFRVYPADVLEEAGTTLPAMSGTYAADEDGDGVCFVPRFPFVEGTAYAVVTEDGTKSSIVRPDRTRLPTASVVEIYPTASEIPFNELKLYVHFSAPMSEGFALRHIRVLSAVTGDELPGVFHPMDPELWDPTRQRLTVLFDPARIKRGLAPHREAGYPLQPGHAVRVVVDQAYTDAAGAPLTAPFERCYDVGADVRTKVDPRAWAMVEPAAASTAPLRIDFDRPLDHALLQHCLVVTDSCGVLVRGRGDAGAEERSWSFTPDEPWARGDYALVVDAMLEDLAGNSVARVFDRDLESPEDAPIDVARITLDFAIR